MLRYESWVRPCQEDFALTGRSVSVAVEPIGQQRTLAALSLVDSENQASRVNDPTRRTCVGSLIRTCQSDPALSGGVESDSRRDSRIFGASLGGIRTFEEGAQ